MATGVRTGFSSISRGAGLLTAVSCKYVAEYYVLSFTKIVSSKAWALGIRTGKGVLTPDHQHSQGAGRQLPLGGRAAFRANIQMYAAVRSLGGRHPVLVADDTNIYIDATTNPAKEHFRSGWSPAASGGPRR